jgi:4,5-dihydroxyphthalate decarboxylase
MRSNTTITAAIGRRYANLHLLSGRAQVPGLDLKFAEGSRVTATGAPMPMFTLLAREHPFDIGEQAFSTYLMAHDLGQTQIALPIFPSRFFPHTGAWVAQRSGIRAPLDLVDRRVACGSFGTNYSVWWRAALTHQYDVPVQRIAWVVSLEEHLLEFRPPHRFILEQVGGENEAMELLLEGRVEAASLPSAPRSADTERTRPLFPDPYPEIGAFVEANGCFPINTVITMRPDVVQRNPEAPHLVMEAFQRAATAYDSEVADGSADLHMGLSLRRLRSEVGLGLPGYGFQENRPAIRAMISSCYEQGIIKKLIDPEDVFLSTDT